MNKNKKGAMNENRTKAWCVVWGGIGNVGNKKMYSRTIRSHCRSCEPRAAKSQHGEEKS